MKNQKGHFFFEVRSLASQLKKRGIPYVIFGNLDADSDCLKLDNFNPALTEITLSIFKKGVSVKNCLYLYRLIKQFNNNLSKTLLFNPVFSIEDEDIIFIHTLYFIEFAGLSWFLWRNSKILAKKNLKVILGLNYPYKKKPFFLTLLLALVYSISDKFFINKSKIKVIYFSTGEVLRKQFEKLLNKKVVFLPTPVLPFPYQPDTVSVDKISPEYSGKIKIAYIGGARYSKGFDIFVQMVEQLSTQDEVSKKIYFLTQANINEEQTPRDFQFTLKYIERLDSLVKKIDNLEIIAGTLTPVEYYKLLFRSDIIILPYRDSGYKTSDSNIFNEAIIAGKVVLVPSYTIIAAYLSKYSLKDLLFKREDVGDLADVIKNIVRNYKYYQEKIKKMQEDYQKIHTLDNLLNSLLKLAS